MSGSGPSVLIAINAHNGHAKKNILVCCQSVALAVERLKADLPGVNSRCCLCCEDRVAFDPMLVAQISALGITLLTCPGASNGERLNRQMEDAIQSCDELFFRVDGDDTVSEQRFSRQVRLFLGSDADIISAGLQYRPVGQSKAYSVCPPVAPRAIDYVFNRFMLHPAMGFRVSTLARTGLRYWTGRLEDKELLLRATELGLKLRNDPAIYGDYSVHQKARSTPELAALSLDLTLTYLHVTQKRAMVPLAYAVWAMRRLLPVPVLRRMRSMLFPAKSDS